MVAGIDAGAVIRKAANRNRAGRGGPVDTVLTRTSRRNSNGFGKDAPPIRRPRAFMSVIGRDRLAFRGACRCDRSFQDISAGSERARQGDRAVAGGDRSIQGRAGSADALKKIVPDAAAAPPDVTAQLEKLKKDWEARSHTNATVKQYAGFGGPAGWTPDRLNAADMKALVWTCSN